MPLDEGDVEAAGCGVERATHAGDPSTDDEYIEGFVRTQSFDSVGTLKTHNARLPTGITCGRRGSARWFPRSALGACATIRVVDAGIARQTPATR